MSGEFSRKGNYVALNAAMSIGGATGSNQGDIVATVNATVTAGAQTSITTTALSRSIPDGALIMITAPGGCDAAQPPDVYVVNGAAAAAATSITVDSRTSLAHTVGDAITVVAYASVWLALNTATPADNALGTEYGATGYARQQCNLALPTAADPPSTQNTALLTYGPMSAGTGTAIPYASLMDALSPTSNTAGNMLAWWTLTTSKTPGVGDSVTVAAGAFTMSCL
jgi:hypothetical protein